MTQFDDLPPEVILNILSYLHFTNLTSCHGTCKRISQIISSSVQLAYQTALQSNGLQDNPYCRLPVARRLEMLIEREYAWATLSHQFVKNIPVPNNTSSLYDFTPGVYLIGKEDDDLMTRSIRVAQLPHQLDANWEWDFINLNATIVDFGSAIEESDLLACAILTNSGDGSQTSRISVVLHRYSTHGLYDGIACPVLSISEQPEAWGVPTMAIEICGENLVVISIFHESKVSDMYIYDWKTGRKKEGSIPVIDDGVVFLREDTLLNVNPQIMSNTLDIYYIPPSSSSGNFCLIQRLCLPQLRDKYCMTFISSRSSPNPTANSSFPKNAPARRPYTSNPEDAIVVFALEVGLPDEEEEDDQDTSQHFVMVVHRKALLDLCPNDIAALEPNTPGMPWEFWGPPRTRWLSVDAYSLSFITLSAGQRFVTFAASSSNPDPEEDDILDTVHVLDFNPWFTRTATGLDMSHCQFVGKKTGHPQSTYLSMEDYSFKDGGTKEPDENICRAGDVFTSDIVSRLPFVRLTSAKKWAYDAVLIDEERLIGITAEYEDEIYRFHSMDVMYIG